MRNINEQLQMGATPRNTNIINSAYARSANNYQVQLGNEDPSLDFYNDTQSLNSMSNADGWEYANGDRDLGEEYMADVEEYNEFLGGYPPCVKARCKECKSDCKYTQGLKWGNGGKECHKSCVAKAKSDQMDRINSMQGGGGSAAIKAGQVIDAAPEKAGMGAGAMVGIAIGGLVLVGLTVFLLRKKK